MTDPAVVELAQSFRATLAKGLPGEYAVTAWQVGAEGPAGSWPDLDAIGRCYTDPGSGCLCAGVHIAEPAEPPPWGDRGERDQASGQRLP